MKPAITIILLLTITVAKGQETTQNDLYSFSPVISTPPINTLKIYAGKELVAYRKTDSNWVFINPGATVLRLEGIAKEYGMKPVRVDTIVNYQPPDTIRFEVIDPRRVVFEAQYCRNCAITWRDGYLINGKPYVIVKSRLVAVNWYRWRIKNDLITNKN